jgi:hypothetical protein
MASSSVPTDNSRPLRSQAQLMSSLQKLKQVLAGEITATAHMDRLSCSYTTSMSNDVVIESMARDLELIMEELIRVRIQTRRRSKETRTQKVKCLVEEWIRKSYPFINLVLTIAKDASAVHRFFPIC